MRWQEDGLIWLHKPKCFEMEQNRVSIVTEPHTDLWQRTYYGFQNDNAPMLLQRTEEACFSFLVKTEFDSKNRFDQCGVVVYQDTENWLKASVEYGNEAVQQLGTVSTVFGYSDWATIDIPAEQKHMYYRLSRRGSDFCVEYSNDGETYHQMRIAHLQRASGEIRVGIYACSPEDSSFHAQFSQISFGRCQWEAHR
ncbi:MAG: DUF1349 domain-containing protein [Butyricicoccus sp.]